MTEQDQETIVAYVFNMVLADVEMGLKGEDAEVFFEMIDQEYQKIHSGCYFSDQVDGNAVGFTQNTKVWRATTLRV